MTCTSFDDLSHVFFFHQFQMDQGKCLRLKSEWFPGVFKKLFPTLIPGLMSSNDASCFIDFE